MFSVLFEVRPKPDQWETYLGYAKMLRPELEGIDGFVDNIRYRSLKRDGWILSLSGWRNEKAVVRWRTRAGHHDVQQKGRDGVLEDYHLRVGQVTSDTRVPPGHALEEQRLDETEVGDGTTATLVDLRGEPVGSKHVDPDTLARSLGLVAEARGLRSWDVLESVATPGDVILFMMWSDAATAAAHDASTMRPAASRARRIRIVRDYAMFDRREAPQFYPDIPRR